VRERLQSQGYYVLRLLLLALLFATSAHAQTPLEAFQRNRTLDPGFGPGFNDVACQSCHDMPVINGVKTPGGKAPPYRSIVWVRRLNSYTDPFILHRAILGGMGVRYPVPTTNYAISNRIPPTALGSGLVERIPDADLLARADPTDANGDGISGRALRDSRGLVARYGWQPCEATLDGIVRRTLEAEFSQEPAMQSEADIARLVEFLRSLPAPLPRVPVGQEALVARGEQVFAEVGCADCHTLAHTLPDGTVIRPLSDYLVHNMGRGLNDGIGLCGARVEEWRTAPLWSNVQPDRPFHDGRGNGAVFEDAMRLHGGEAARSVNNLFRVYGTDGPALRAFVASR